MNRFFNSEDSEEMDSSIESNSEQEYDSEANESNEETEKQPVLGKRGRKENGLVTLTHKFISLLKGSPNQTIDLNLAVTSLRV